MLPAFISLGYDKIPKRIPIIHEEWVQYKLDNLISDS